MNENIAETPVDQHKLLEKFDTESRFRRFDKGSIPGWIVFFMCIGLSLFHLYTAWTGPLTTLMHRAVHT